MHQSKRYKKIVVLDTVIFYPEHRRLINSIADEVVEYPSSLPENLEKQYTEQPELFLNKKCYTQIATDDTPLQLLMNRVEGADVIISCWTNIPDEVLRLNPQLKLIIFWTHEKEHRINVALAEELGIGIANIPDYGTDAVAEVVFAGMWQLLMRNAPAEQTGTPDQLAHAVMNDLFTRLRKLPINEKNTRSGKFSHHFHKMGQAKFDFTQKHIDELIPERLVAYKRIGLLNLPHADHIAKALSAFHVICDVHDISDSATAPYYAFLCDQEVIYYNSSTINPIELKKILLMFGKKCVDVTMLPTSNYQISGKVFGIIGLGRIGTKVAKTAKRLGFDVAYYSKTRNRTLEEQLGISYADLNTLAEKSDIVSVHLPAHKAENLLNTAFISQLKPGSIFINTADGNAVDQVALTQRMMNKEIYAYLDVYPGLPRKDILGMPMADKTDWKIKKELSNNVIAYRAGWKTQESINVKTYKLLGAMIDQLSQ